MFVTVFLPSEGDEHGGHVFVDTIVQRSLVQLGRVEGDEYGSHVPQCDIIQRQATSLGGTCRALKAHVP